MLNVYWRHKNVQFLRKNNVWSNMDKYRLYAVQKKKSFTLFIDVVFLSKL